VVSAENCTTFCAWPPESAFSNCSSDPKALRRDAQGRDVFEVWADMVLANPAAEYARVARDILPAETPDNSNGSVANIQALYLTAVQQAQRGFAIFFRSDVGSGTCAQVSDRPEAISFCCHGLSRICTVKAWQSEAANRMHAWSML
jgi:hypothetical protein